ncbi:MAG: alpha/beta fold hydrolase [Phyllobacterium sp.]
MLKVIRLGFGILEHFSPQRAGRLAFYLFCRTPSRKPKNQVHARSLQQTDLALSKVQRLDLRIAAGSVATYFFEPRGIPTDRVSLVVHGWGSRSGDMLALINSMTDGGEAVVSLDLPGHGNSSGRSLTMVSAVAAIDAAWRQYGPFNAVVGHSFGGAVAINSARGSITCTPARLPDKLVTIASPSSLADVIENIQDMLGLGKRARIAMSDQVLRLAGKPLSSFDGGYQLAHMDLPVLVVHAPDDKEVALSHAETLADAGDHVQLYLADGFGHRRIIASKDIADRIASFVTNAASHDVAA